MNALKNLSINRKLTFIITITSTIAVLMACLAFLFYDRITFKAAMIRDLRTLSNVIGANSTAALAFSNRDDATETLASLRAEKHVIAAAIYLADGSVFATYHRDNLTFHPPQGVLSQPTFYDNYVDVAEPIIFGTDPIGQVLIRSDLEEMRARQERYVFLVVIFLVFACFSALLLTSRLQRIISQPILKLADLARAVSIHKDYSIRAKTENHDETGILIGAFNEMLTQIQERDIALENANDSLEQRVGERTQELLHANAQLRKEIQERESAETALIEREEQLLQSQKMDAIGKLAGGIAHDFNNQLAIVQGYTDMILENLVDDPTTQNRLHQIANVVARATKLTQQLLLFSSKQPIQLRPLDLNHHVIELKTMLERLMHENIILQVDLSSDLSIVHADSGNINQLITNLFLNARDALPDGGTLTVKTRMVHIDEAFSRNVPDTSIGSTMICLSIEDSGIGMSEDVKDHIFEPFFTTKEIGKGTGLGLSVVYGIVQSHGGWITVESSPNRGSRFDVFLQPHIAMIEESIQHTHPYDPSNLGRQERILLIEDEVALGEMTQQLLSQKEYQVTLCQTAAEARSVFESSPSGFDLVLSDVMLPDGRGPGVVMDLLKKTPSLKALFMTGYTDNHIDRDRIREAGLTLLQKPVPTPMLLEQIRKALDA
jgi:signal transduction histidine kinase